MNKITADISFCLAVALRKRLINIILPAIYRSDSNIALLCNFVFYYSLKGLNGEMKKGRAVRRLPFFISSAFSCCGHRRGCSGHPCGRPRRPSRGRWRSCRRCCDHPCGRPRKLSLDRWRSCQDYYLPCVFLLNWIDTFTNG
ncbi:hypothetical protein PXNS11_100039 [Stutzerimonas xanthomarina]|nr:hypothetical protein PXNS11_100039 [Stutzerimonas xanthomarina]